MRQPSLFISHGAPDIAIADTPATSFLRGLAARLPRPRAIVVASAHFEAEGRVLVSADAEPTTIRDFGGFDRRLHEIEYPAPGDPALARDVADRLTAAGLEAGLAANRGFDHGTWVPLHLMVPEADVPVVQVSVDPTAGPEHHLALGEALRPLRDENVLVIGSGAFTHDLRAAFVHVRAGQRAAETPAYVDAFAAWMSERILAGDRASLLRYRREAPFAAENHPTDEHLMPLYVALGAADPDDTPTLLHSSRDYGAIGMEAFAFGLGGTEAALAAEVEMLERLPRVGSFA
jgi:4,5-DOPA dioxygenase extradiol